MFWNMLGVAYLHPNSKVVDSKNVMYWLDNSKVSFPNKLQKKLDKFYMDQRSVNLLEKETIKYTYSDNTKINIPLGQIKAFADLSNGTGNWYGSNSALDALYKVISNSDTSLDAKNVNLFMSKKFMVGGDKSADNINEMPLGEREKQSIEQVVTNDKAVTSFKSLIAVKRFVENIDHLKLDEAYFSSCHKIAKIYGIPKDVIENHLNEGSTYENQEKARGSHVSYTLSPKAEDLANGLENYFGLDVKLKFSWDDLQFMQVFEKEKSEIRKNDAKTFETYIKAGADPQSVADLLELNIEFNENDQD